MVDKVPDNYSEVTATTTLPAKEPGLDKVRKHYLAKGCKVYLANKKALSAKGLKGADFIVVCPHGDGKCVAVIEVKDGNQDCKNAVEQLRSSVKYAQDAGYVGAGANPDVTVSVYNSNQFSMDDQAALDKPDADISIGTDKRKPKFIGKNGTLPC